MRAIPYTDPELLHPEDLIWPVGINNFRVQYTAGYAAVPDDIQEACAEWVATLFWQVSRDPGLSFETATGAFSRGSSTKFGSALLPQSTMTSLISIL